ncbi:MAG: preprotein translocase subunit YajC [Hyphomicrobiaceae bacterium]
MPVAASCSRCRTSKPTAFPVSTHHIKDVSMFFITPAYAQAPGADPLTSMLIPLALMIPIFYFLVIRPNQQREKQRRELISAVRRGDTVVLGNGFIGKVVRAKDNENELEIELNDQMRIRVTRGAVTEVRGKGEPVKDA